MPKLGVVVFGASKFEHHRELDNRRFANSAKEFLKTISDPEILPDHSVRSLDLYDQSISPNDTLNKIADFVSEDFDGVVIYYCGHGDVSRARGEYRVFLQQSKRDRRHATMLDVFGLIGDVQRIAAQKTVYFVLDACYSGAVIDPEFMDAGGAEAIVERSLAESISQHGIAVFTATGGLDPALAKNGDKLSLFTGAFVRCLKEGIPYKREVQKLSWLEVRDEIARATRDRLGPDAPVPKITSLDEKFGDVTRVPFFLNRAYAPAKAPIVTSEELYWRNLPDDPPLSVLHDFLVKFSEGIFAPLARALADRKIGRATEDELEEHLRYHRETEFAPQIKARLTVLKRDRIRGSFDVIALETIIARDGDGELALEARRRLDANHEEQEAWKRLGTSQSGREFEEFLKLYPDGRFSAQASLRLADLAVQAAPPAPLRLNVVSRVSDFLRARVEIGGSSLVGLKGGLITWPVAFAVLTLVGVLGALIAGSGIYSTGKTPMSANNIDVAGDTRGQQARDRLAAIGAMEAVRSRKESDGKELAAVPNDVASLNAFVDKCERASCLVLQDANVRLAMARSAESLRLRKEADGKALAAVANDVASLNGFLDTCKRASCPVLDDANARLVAAQAAEAARFRKEADGRELAAIPNDVARLNAFVLKCRASACGVLQDAIDRTASAQMLADADRTELDAAGSDVNLLRKIVQRCDSLTCSVAQEARDRLATAEEAARDSKQGSFRAFTNYDIYKNDIENLFNTTVANCSAKCGSTNDCVAFVFDKWNSACYLKRRSGPLALTPRSDAFLRTDQQPFYTSTTTHTCPYNDSSMRGESVRPSNAQSTDMCRRDCEAETSCTAYMFRKVDRQCSLFRNVSDRTKKDPTSDSGERTQNPC